MEDFRFQTASLRLYFQLMSSLGLKVSSHNTEIKPDIQFLETKNFHLANQFL